MSSLLASAVYAIVASYLLFSHNYPLALFCSLISLAFPAVAVVIKLEEIRTLIADKATVTDEKKGIS